jgi:hypothetical protein
MFSLRVCVFFLGALSLLSHRQVGPAHQGHPLPPCAARASHAATSSHLLQSPRAPKLRASRCRVNPLLATLISLSLTPSINPLSINGINHLHADCSCRPPPPPLPPSPYKRRRPPVGSPRTQALYFPASSELKHRRH